MAPSRKRSLSLCRETLRRWFNSSDGKPIEFDKLEKADREAILAAAEECRTELGAKYAVEECYRGLVTDRLDAAERLPGPHE